MTVSTNIQIRSKGTLTLPIEFRRKYQINEGDVITLIDLGEGSFFLTPGVTKVNYIGDRVAQKIAEEGSSLEDIYTTLDEERERYYQERYAKD